jgi:hypothetical protein
MAGDLIGIEWEPQFTLLRYPNHSVYFKVTKKRKPFIHLEYTSPEIYKLEQTFKRVFVELPLSYNVKLSNFVALKNWHIKNPYRYVSIDNINFEVITKPVTLDKLPNEMVKADQHLKKFCLKIEKLVGPLGVFLPTWELGFSQPSKHVNISSKKEMEFIDIGGKFLRETLKIAHNGFSSTINFKGECRIHQRRLHITVPYNFTDYKGLMELTSLPKISKADLIFYLYEWSLKHPMPYMKSTKKRGIFLAFLSGKEYNKVGGLL